MSLYSIITQLQSTSSSNEKKAILLANKNNTLLKSYVGVCLNPQTNFYITEKTFPKPSCCGAISFSESTVENFVLFIAERYFTGDDAKKFIKNQLELHDEESQQLIKWMLLKDFRANVGDKIVNTVWPNLIPVVEYMRCSLPKAANLANWDWNSGVYSQLKADGMYAIVSKNGVVTRNGNKFPNECFSEILKELEELDDGVVLNGELVIVKVEMINSFYKKTTLSRKEGNGILNSIMQGGTLPNSDYEIHYHTWDIVSEELKKKPYHKRFDILSEFVNGAANPYISVIDTEIVYSMEEATRHFKQMLQLGMEGTILKSAQMKWADGTSKFCVKYKIEAEMEMRVVGITEGTGKAAGMMGSIEVASSDYIVQTSCGSGFSDAQRKEIFETFETEWLNKIVTIKANDIVDKRGSNVYSLFLPIFIEKRNDKKVANSYEEIKAIFDNVKGIV